MWSGKDVDWGAVLDFQSGTQGEHSLSGKPQIQNFTCNMSHILLNCESAH